MTDPKTPAETIDDYPLHTYDKLRYSDTDMQGHINNTVYSAFFETGRSEFVTHVHREAGIEGAEFVLAQITIQYLRETHWPGTVEVGSRLKKIGNSSLVVEQSLFHNGELKARSESVIVQINTATRKSEPFNERMRACLESQLALQARGSAAAE